jgi:hypothetical protein
MSTCAGANDFVGTSFHNSRHIHKDTKSSTAVLIIQFFTAIAIKKPWECFEIPKRLFEGFVRVVAWIISNVADIEIFSMGEAGLQARSILGQGGGE